MGRRAQVQPDGVGDLEKAVRAHRAAEQRLATAMLEALERGSSLRTIALVAGLSHETVRVIVARERKRVAEVEGRLARPIAVLTLTDRTREEAARRKLARTLPVKNPDAL